MQTNWITFFVENRLRCTAHNFKIDSSIKLIYSCKTIVILSFYIIIFFQHKKKKKLFKDWGTKNGKRVFIANKLAITLWVFVIAEWNVHIFYFSDYGEKIAKYIL